MLIVTKQRPQDQKGLIFGLYYAGDFCPQVKSHFTTPLTFASKLTAALLPFNLHSTSNFEPIAIVINC